MSEFFQLCIKHGFRGGDIRRLGEVDGNDNDSVQLGNFIEQLILLSRAFENDVQAELAAKIVGSQRVLFVQSVKHDPLTGHQMIVHCVQG